MNDETSRKAMDKIRDELAGTKNGLVQQIGEIMTELLLIAPELSDRILAEGKTCEGAANHCKRYARRYCTKDNNGEVGTSDEEDAQCLGEYWEIKPEEVAKAMLARNLREAMQRFGGKLPDGISFLGAEPQAHAQVQPTAPAAAAAGGSLLDDFDSLLGGL